MSGRVAHHFDNAHQQFHAATLGMWIFLATEVMFFGGMFAAYTVYRFAYPEAFMFASKELHTMVGTINTAVLLLSSLFVALAVHAAFSGRNKATAAYLAGGILMGLVFLGVKAYEYSDKWAHHRVPGPNFSLEPHGAHGEAAPADEGAHPGEDAHTRGVALQEEREAARGVSSTASEFAETHMERDDTFAGHVQLFYGLYFAMTGLHAIHMVIGVVMLGVIAVAAWRGAFNQEYYTPVEIGGLYWHFVDIVWVFLFPLLYLIR